MARRKNRNRNLGTRANNKWGSRAPGIDDDHPMHGTDSSPPRKRGGPNRRGGRNNPNQARNQLWNQHNQNPLNTNTQTNIRNGFRGQRGRSGRGGRGGGRGDRGGRGRNTGVFTDTANNPFGDLLPTGPVADDQGSGNGSGNGSLPRSLSATYPNFHGNSNNGSRVRFCTECSAVRRSNLRFRNVAAQALKRCNEHFIAWADEAGVGFGTSDEMDWQPEPVIRVLLLPPPPPPPPPPKQGSPPSQDSLSMEEPLQPPQEQDQHQQQQQHYQQQHQQHPQYPLNQQYTPGPITMPTPTHTHTPTPGPWPWPPWEKPPVLHQRSRTPAFSAPAFAPIPTAAPILGTVPSGSGGSLDGLSGSNMPVSGFGLLGAAAATTGAPLSSRILDQFHRPPSLRWEFT
ncbi:hypothetical protein GGR53DRAFT_348188 [Hypoxylon sp. FL1150]|nr:hypothetical protein GGR53DRAFT_348188 [Hypoxylon sp. FL1150]